MQEYESSILSEIRDYNIFLYSILRQAECTFTADDEMTLTIEKNVIAEERLEELLQILEKIFCERCGMHFKVQTVFKEPVESKSHKNSELRIQQEVDAILQNAVLGNPEEPQNLPEENGQVEAAKAEGKAEGEAIGEARVRMLINRLIADGRMDEIGRIIDSAEACRELYKEYGL